MNKPKDKTKGSMLKETREAKGITLEMVQEATKIPLDVLRAIEEGYSIKKLSPFYYRGFVKMYAQFLDLDPAEVLTDYKLPPPSATHYPKAPAPAAPKTQFLYQDFLRDKVKPVLHRWFSPERRALMLQIAFVLVALFIVVKVFGWVGAHLHNHKKSQTVAQKAEHKNQTVKKDDKAGAAEPGAREDSERIAAALTAVEEKSGSSESRTVKSKAESNNVMRVSLTIRAKKDSWIQVKVDGEVVFQSAIKRGFTESWFAKDRIELSGKNVNQLEFEVNGKLLGALGPAERKAKKVVITKDGLSVPK